MIKTSSYFSSVKSFGRRVGISRSMPKGFETREVCSVFMPTEKLLKDYKAGKVSWADYEGMYLQGLEAKKETREMASAVAELKRYGAGGDKENQVVLLCCWEKNPLRCHRRLVAIWL